jgi:hypothetical protein
LEGIEKVRIKHHGVREHAGLPLVLIVQREAAVDDGSSGIAVAATVLPGKPERAGSQP